MNPHQKRHKRAERRLGVRASQASPMPSMLILAAVEVSALLESPATPDPLPSPPPPLQPRHTFRSARLALHPLMLAEAQKAVRKEE
jgi:hypothetical protein